MLYDAFVELFVGRREPKPATNIPFPELHQHSLGSMGYLKTLAKLMQAVGVHDFRVMEDLVAPDKKRLRHHLAALINFVRHREAKLDAYSQWTKRTDELLESKAEMEERQNLDNQRLQALREQQKQQEPVILALTEECAKLEKQVNEVNIRQATLHAQSDKLKHQRDAARASVETHKAQIANCEADIAAIRGAIVENPAALEAAIRELAGAIEQEHKITAKIEEESQALGRKVKVLTELQRDLRESVGVLREYADEERRAASHENDIGELRATGEALAAALQQQETEREQLEVQAKSLAEKAGRVRKQQKKRELEAAKDVEKAAAERDKAARELQQSENVTAENGREVERMERKLLALHDGHAAEMGKLKDITARLETQVQQYHAELRQALSAN